MDIEEKRKRVINKKKFTRNICISLVALLLVAGIFVIAPNYMKDDDDGKAHVLINNKNLTSPEGLSNDNRLSKDKVLSNNLLIENGVVYLSKEDISRFFDKYLYYDSKYNQYITTSDTKVATIEVGAHKMEVNGISSVIVGTILEKDGVIYLPFSEMADVYNVEVQNVEETNTVIIDSLDREQKQAEASKNLSVKLKTKFFSRTIDKVLKGEKVVVISQTNDGWTKVRTAKGKIGYVKTDKLQNETIVRENLEKTNQLADQKISMVWDYYSESKVAPNRNGTTITGINVVAPSFFVLKKLGQGEIIDKVGENGKQYITWAKNNNYRIWAMFSNDSMIETTSEILNDYKLRKQAIEKIVDLAVRYGLDGINLDFENIYQADKDLYTRFVTELYPRLKDVGMTLTVDVTAPDGGETWSLCFDRDALADNCDYLVFMGYDQNNASSTKAGPIAGYNWVKNNVDKFLGQEAVSNKKLILGMPFYTRLWTEDSEGKLKNTSIVNMKDVNNVIAGKGNPTWDETTKLDYLEYKQGNNTYKIWIENAKSIKEKLQLIKDKELAGAAYWAKDRESGDIWEVIKENLK